MASSSSYSVGSRLSTTLPSLRSVRSSYELQIATLERVVHARSGGGAVNTSSFLSAMFKFATGKLSDLDFSGGFLEWVPIDDFRIGLELVFDRPVPIRSVDVSGWCTQEQGQLLLALVQHHRTIVFVRCGGVMAAPPAATIGRGVIERGGGAVDSLTSLHSPVSEGGDFSSVGSSPLTTARLLAKAADPHLAQQRAPVTKEMVWRIAEACVLNVEYCAKFERVTAMREQKAVRNFFAAQLEDLISALEAEETQLRSYISEERRKKLLKMSAVEHMQLVSAHRATKRREQEIDFEVMRQDVRDSEAYDRWIFERRQSAAHMYIVSASFQHLRRSLVASNEAHERAAITTDCHESRWAIRRREGIRRQANREAVAALSLEEFGARRDTAVLEAQFRAHLSGCLRDLNVVALEFQGARSVLDDGDNRVRRVETDKIEKERHAFKEHVRHEDGRMHLERIRERERFFQRYHQSNASLEREEASEFRLMRELRLLLFQAAKAMAAASTAESKLASFCTDDCGLKLQIEGRTHLHSYAIVAVTGSTAKSSHDLGHLLAEPPNAELALPWAAMSALGLRFDAMQDANAPTRMSKLVDDVRSLRRKAQVTLEDTDTKVLFDGGADRCAFAVQHDVRPPSKLDDDVSPSVNSFLSQRRIVRGATIEFRLQNTANTSQASSSALLSAASANNGSFAAGSVSSTGSDDHATFNNNSSLHNMSSVSPPKKAKLRGAAMAVIQSDTTVFHPTFDDGISCVGFEDIGSAETIMGVRWERVDTSGSNTTITLQCSTVTEDNVVAYDEPHHRTFCNSVSTLLNRVCFRRVLHLDGLDVATAAAKTVSAGWPPTAAIVVRVTVVGDGVPTSVTGSAEPSSGRYRKLSSSTPLSLRSCCAAFERVLNMEVRPPLFASALPMSKPIQLVREHGCGAVLGKLRRQVFPADTAAAGSPKGKRLSNAAIVDMLTSAATPKHSHHSHGQNAHASFSHSPGEGDGPHGGNIAAAPFVAQFKLPSLHNESILTLRLIPEDPAAQQQLSLVLRLDPGVLSLNAYSQGSGALLRGKAITLSPCPKFFVLAASTSDGAFHFPSPTEATRMLEVDLGNDNVSTGDLVAFLQQCVTVSPVDGCTLAHGLAARIRCEMEDPLGVVSIFEVPFTTALPMSPAAPASPTSADQGSELAASPLIDDTPFGFVSPDPRRPLIIHPGPDPNLVGMPNTPDIHHAVRLMPRLSVLLARAVTAHDLSALAVAANTDGTPLSSLEQWVMTAIADVVREQTAAQNSKVKARRGTSGVGRSVSMPASTESTPTPLPQATSSPLISGATVLHSPIGDIRVHGVVHVRPVPEEREVPPSPSHQDSSNGSGSFPAMEWVEDPHDGRFVVFAPRHKGIGFSRRPSQAQKNKAFEVTTTGPVFVMKVLGCTLRELAFELQEIYVSTTHFMLRPRVASLMVTMELTMRAPGDHSGDNDMSPREAEGGEKDAAAESSSAVPPAMQDSVVLSRAPSRGPSRGPSRVNSVAQVVLPGVRSPPPVMSLELEGAAGVANSATPEEAHTAPPPPPPWLPFRSRVVVPIEVCEAQMPIAPQRKRIPVVENTGGWTCTSPFLFTKPDAAVWCDAFNGGRLSVNISDGKGPEDILVMRSMSSGPIRLRLVSVTRVPKDRVESPAAGPSRPSREKSDVPSPATADAPTFHAGTPGAAPSPALPTAPPQPVAAAASGPAPILAPAAIAAAIAAAAIAASTAGKTSLVTTPRRKGPHRPGKVDDSLVDSILSPNTTDLMSALSHRRGARLPMEMLEDDITHIMFDTPHPLPAPLSLLSTVQSRPNIPLARALSNATSPASNPLPLPLPPKRTPTELRLSDLMAQIAREDNKDGDASDEDNGTPSTRPASLKYFQQLEDTVQCHHHNHHHTAGRASVISPIPSIDHLRQQHESRSEAFDVTAEEDVDDDASTEALKRRIRALKAAWLVRDYIRNQIGFGRGQEVMSFRRASLLPSMVRTYEVYRDTLVAESATPKDANGVTLGASGVFGRLPPSASFVAGDPFSGLHDDDNDDMGVKDSWKRLGTLSMRRTALTVDFVEANQDAAPISSDDVLALLGNVAYACDPCTVLTNSTKLLEYTVVPADGPELRFSQLLAVQKTESHPTVQLLRHKVYYAPNAFDVLCIGALPVTPYAQCFVQAHAGPNVSSPLCFDGGKLQYEIISGDQEGDNLYLMTRDEQLKAKNLYEIWRQEQMHLRHRDEPVAPQVEELLHKFQPYEGIGEVSATGKMMRTYVQNRQRGDEANFSIGMTEAYNPLKVLVELGPWQPEHCQALHVMTAMNAVGFRTSAGPGDRVVRITLVRGGPGGPLTTHVKCTICVRAPQVCLTEGPGRPVTFTAPRRYLRAPSTIVSVFPATVTIDLGPDPNRVLRQGFVEFRMVGVETGERLCFRCPSPATDSVAPVAAAPPADGGGKKKGAGKGAVAPAVAAAASTTSSSTAPAHTSMTGEFGNMSLSATSLLLGGTIRNVTTPLSGAAVLPPPFCMYGRRLFAADGASYIGVVTVSASTLIKIEFDYSSQCTAQHLMHLVRCLHMMVGRGAPAGVSPNRRVEMLLCSSDTYGGGSLLGGTPSADGFTSMLASVVSLDAAEGAAATTDDAA